MYVHYVKSQGINFPTTQQARSKKKNKTFFLKQYFRAARQVFICTEDPLGENNFQQSWTSEVSYL